MSPKENLLRVIHHDHPQWVPNGMESRVAFGAPVCERPERAGLDAWNVRWDYNEGAKGGTYPAHGGHTITNLRRWRDQITIPDVAAMDWDDVGLLWGADESSQASDVKHEEHLFSGFVEFGLFERSYLLLGMDEALMAYVTDTDRMEAMLGAIADYKIALCERFADVVDLDIIWYGDDWGTQQNLFIPPDIWRKTVGKPTARIHQCIKERGILINQHTDGTIESIFGDMVDMGVNIWNPCQPCNDLAALKREYSGRITFCGAIDSQFVRDRPGVTPDDVRAEGRKRIDELAEGGGYVAGPSHGVPYRQEIVDAMNDEIATYGRQFYQARDSVA